MKTQITTVLAALLLGGCSSEFENSPAEGVEPITEQDTITQPEGGTENPNPQAGPSQLEQPPPELENTNTNASASAQATPASISKASEMLGMDVQDGSDKRLGAIEDIRFSDDGAIASLALSTGGILGIGDKEVSVPMAALERSPSGENFIMAASAENLREADSAEMMDDAGSTAWGGESKESNGIKPLSEVQKGGTESIGNEPLDALRLDKRDAGQPRDATQQDSQPQASSDSMHGVKKTSAWSATPVKSSNGETLGQVEDFVVDFQSGRVAYVLISLSDSGKRVAVPRETFKHQNGALILSASRASLEAAPEYAPGNPLPPQRAWGEEPRGPEHYSPSLEAPNARDSREKVDIEFERLNVDNPSAQ